ncbi:hypothetical protein [Streptomyces sp. NPDC003996]
MNNGLLITMFTALTVIALVCGAMARGLGRPVEPAGHGPTRFVRLRPS